MICILFRLLISFTSRPIFNVLATSDAVFPRPFPVVNSLMYDATLRMTKLKSNKFHLSLK